MKAAMRAATRGAENSEKISRIREILERAKKEIENLG
jgi:hypothetical protein